MNTDTTKEVIVIVTPIYEDKEAATLLFKDIKKIINREVYIIAVDDGSLQYPMDIGILKNIGLQGVVLKLKRNVGHQCAIAIGLNYAAEELSEAAKVVVMDSDGEDMPETINNLLSTLENTTSDIVVATRKSRTETLKFKIFYKIYKGLFRILSGRYINFGNFMAMKMSALKRLVSMQELWIHVAGCILSSKLKVIGCPLNRGTRYAGNSRMNFVSLVLHGFKGLMVFAEDVLVRVGIACSFIAIITVLGGFTAIILKIFDFATPGWFSIALGILLLVFLQTAALTLMSLMLTGVVKSGAVSKINYKDFIFKVLHS